jgi:hypothetical protein
MVPNTSKLSFLNSSDYKENREFLNWPGLQYLWYTKIKPMVHGSVNDDKFKYDDENWYISYDCETGEVYLVYTEDNQNFYFDNDGSCGSILDFNGMLQISVDSKYSSLESGFIDDHVGCIGVNSDQIGDATGILYCRFDRGHVMNNVMYNGNQTIDQLRDDMDNTVRLMNMVVNDFHGSNIDNPEFKYAITDRDERILSSVNVENETFIADLSD